MRQLLFSLLLAPCSLLLAQAYDVEVDGICYNIIGTRLAYVTHRDFHTSEPDYTGDVVVPEYISHNGRTYHVFSVGDNAFAGCDELTSVQLPASVRAISPCAFIGCASLREVSLPTNLQAIANCAFTGCTSLQKIVVPRCSEFVDSLTFYCCASLTSLILPHRIQTVYGSALEHLPSMKDLYCYASLPPVAEQGAFTLADQKRCTLHVPRETIDLYRKASVWSDFYRIVPLKDSEYLAQNYQKGDVNDDGKVDAEDLAMLRRIIVSLPDDSAVHWAADINGDGKVNSVDYVMLAKSL